MTRDNAPTAPAYRMRIPNAEVRECFVQQILGLFRFSHTAQAPAAQLLVQSLVRGDSAAVEQHLTWLLQRFLSFQMLGPRSRSLTAIVALIDEFHHPRLQLLFKRVNADLPERVYHLLAFGLLCGYGNLRLTSLDMDRELGGGRPDISFYGP